MTQISTCLWFHAHAEDAVALYCHLFPGARITGQTSGPAGPSGPPLVINFDLLGQSYAAMNGGDYYTLSPAASIMAVVDGQAEVDRLWSALLEGGGMESRCGWLVDRYGLSWQIIPEGMLDLLKDDKTGKAWRAMMGMIKLDLGVMRRVSESG